MTSTQVQVQKFILGKSYINEQIDVSYVTWQNVKRRVQQLYTRDTGIVLSKPEKKKLDYDQLIRDFNDRIQINNNMIRDKKIAKQEQVQRNKVKKTERMERRIKRETRKGNPWGDDREDRFANRVPLSELGELVSERLASQNITGRFSTTLKSTIANVTQKYNFNHATHFKNWLKKLTERDGDSQGTNNTVDKNLFPPDGTVEVASVEAVAGGCNTNKAGPKKMKSSFYNYKLFQPFSRNNNCFFATLKYLTKVEVDVTKLRAQFNIPAKTKVTVDDAYKIITFLDVNVQIIDYQTNEELDSEQPYLVLAGDHYYALTSFEMNKRKDNKTKRGSLSFDFETRLDKSRYNIIHSGAKIIDG